MGRSWLAWRLVLSCALLLAAVGVEGRHRKEEESSSEEERPCERRHHSAEKCCPHHEDAECCWEKWCPHHEEAECCWETWCPHHQEAECCWEKWCPHHQEEECCCQKRHHHKDEARPQKKHSHGKKEAGKKKHRHVGGEEEEADQNKVGKKHPKKRLSFLEKLEEASSESSEFYRLRAKEEQKMIMGVAAQSSDAVPPHRKKQAVAHFNRGSLGSYYKPLEDGQLKYKKAIGVMVYVNMILAKTNCTKTKEQEVPGVEYSRAYLEKEGCQLLPKLKQEKENCTFGVFIDMRTEKKAVVSQECTELGIKRLFHPLRDLDF